MMHLEVDSREMGDMGMDRLEETGMQFFHEMRHDLGRDSQQKYSEFIQGLWLFSQDIIADDTLTQIG